MPGIIWTTRGPAHWTCWVERVKQLPIAPKKLTFDPNVIYENYYDAMTGVLLTPQQAINRFNKRQYFTYELDLSPKPPQF